MENNNKQKLEELIKKSNLKEDQKYLWQLFLKISNKDEDEAVYEAAQEGNESLILLSKHLEDKLWDMKARNKDAWAKLTSSEEEFAKELV